MFITTIVAINKTLIANKENYLRQIVIASQRYEIRVDIAAAVVWYNWHNN